VHEKHVIVMQKKRSLVESECTRRSSEYAFVGILILRKVQRRQIVIML
jgi:hypothetical protein